MNGVWDLIPIIWILGRLRVAASVASLVSTTSRWGSRVYEYYCIYMAPSPNFAASAARPELMLLTYTEPAMAPMLPAPQCIPVPPRALARNTCTRHSSVGLCMSKGYSRCYLRHNIGEPSIEILPTLVH